MRQHSLVWIGTRGVVEIRRARPRFTSCTCAACRAPIAAPAPLSWRRRLALIAAGFVVGQLLVILFDRVVGGPGPFAWIGLLFGKALS